ncbi:MAG: hypothetical protein Q9181_004091 [Wetmoreana brouardii]
MTLWRNGMKIRSLKAAFSPSNGHICLSCRLRLPYTNLQSRRQQHADAQASSPRPESLLALLSKLRGEDAQKEAQDSEALDLRSPRKPSAEAERLQHRLHEKFIAQRRKDALSILLPTDGSAWSQPPKKTKSEKAREKKIAKAQQKKQAKDLKKDAKVAKKKLKTQDRTAKKPAKSSEPGEKLADRGQPSEPPIQVSSEVKVGEIAGDATSETPSPKNPIVAGAPTTNKDNGTLRDKPAGMTPDKPGVSDRLRDRLQGLVDALRGNPSTKRQQPSSTQPASLEARKESEKRTRATEAKESSKPGPVKRKAGNVRKVSTGVDTVIRQVSTPEPVSMAKDGTKQVKARKSTVLPGHKLDVADIQKLDACELKITAIEMQQPPVPQLSYGLERVLFNPGVYHLQDPRSRVYNFDPYLQSIMPVTEFDFNALKEYITSSRDTALQDLAHSYKKRYVGSSSSMTGILAHFHFLLSQWRAINTNMLSREFPEKHITRFTELQRSPSAVFLRWRNGSYAIDADKEFAGANVLMSLGKSMEKLLTLRTEDFERYRKSSPDKVPKEEQSAPESYHYSTMGDFIMRSQLDAHDPRLPGTGMFDLKTRAVVSVRMDASNYEEGKGYQIRSRQGAWESFEREYFDMIRAAFLKYSLQVRMGRMDGIFVAFHNTDRIFGFQYISLSEMDSTLHGQWDTSLGDQEFKLSVSLLNEVLNKATKKYPNTVGLSARNNIFQADRFQSIRLHFETREAQTPFMYIFAEPVTEDQITAIQTANDAKVHEFEQQIYGNKKDTNDDEAEDQGWANLQANVRDAMDEDIRDPNHEDRRQDLDPDLKPPQQNVSHENASPKGHFPIESNHNANSAAIDDDSDPDEQVGDEDEEETAADDVEVDGDNEERGSQGVLVNNAVDKNTAALETRNGGPPEILADDETDQGPDSQADFGDVSDTQEAKELDEEDEGPPKKVQPEDPEVVEGFEGKASDGTDGGLIETDKYGIDGAANISFALPDALGKLREEVTAMSGDDANEAGGEEFPTHADVPFIEGMSQKSTTRPEGKEVLAMTLTIRNKVNKGYVLRPDDLGPDDDWSIEYSLDEVPSPDRAWSLYQACQVRRKKKLDEANSRNEDDDQVDSYIRMLREMSRKGARWRKMQDEKEKTLPLKVLGEAVRTKKEDMSEA